MYFISSFQKQEPIEPTMVSGFMSSHSEGFHSSSPSSSSRGSPSAPRSPPFRPLTPPGFESSPTQGRPTTAQLAAEAVTPPKSPSPSPPWTSNSEGMPSPIECSPDNGEEPGLRVPTVNSHGKVKTFKCKQCEFVAVTKMAFWEHTKSHIKPERMLNCPKCPFVTEYKHHLEYHMRNHLGCKPFQCPQCSYSCVNKSMLNSHLKSHSNIYQYRCADCNYATKYCHSLKLHLRKYQHQPAMVLNQDGTPNPLPIIDVYGTRRGPKQRCPNKEETINNNNNNVQPHHPLFQNPFAVNFPYGSLMPHSMLFPNGGLPKSPMNDKNNYERHSSPSPNHEEHPMRGIHSLSPHLLMQQRFLNELNQSQQNFLTSNTTLPATLPQSSPDANSARSSYSPPLSNHSSPHVSPRESPREEPASDALDLTRTSYKQEIVHSPTPLTPTANLKNRRKGRAFKLERSVPRVEQAGDHHERDIPDISRLLKNTEPERMEIQVDIQNHIYEAAKDLYEADKGNQSTSSKPAEVVEDKVVKAPVKESYDCQYCDIVFKDIIMYTMHMGYHGFKDPFTCNMCGERSADKIAFFVHIARSQHS